MILHLIGTWVDPAGVPYIDPIVDQSLILFNFTPMPTPNSAVHFMVGDRVVASPHPLSLRYRFDAFLFVRRKYRTIATSHRVDLDCGNSRILRIASIQGQNLFAVTSREHVSVYKHDTQGKAFRVFKEHQFPVVGLLWLDAQIVESLDIGSTIFTWKASCGTILDTLKLGIDN